MRDLNLRYAREVYDAEGVLVDFSLEYPDEFNWAFDIVDDIALAEPDRPAMVWLNPDGERHEFSFGDIKYWSDKTANFLASAGIQRGDVVLVMLRRHYQFWFTAVALHKLGAILLPATFMLKEQDLEYRFNKASVKAVVVTATGDIADNVDAALPNSPTVQTRILVNAEGGPEQSGPEGLCTLPSIREGWLDFNAGVREANAEFQTQRGLVTDPFLVYFSSGTSGHPKMILHDGTYPLGHIPTAKHWHCVKSDGGLHLTIADTGWGKAVWGKLYGQWIMEACVLTYDFDRFDGAEILGLIEKEKVTTLCCPPTMYRLMMLEDVDSFDLSSLEHCTTAGEALNPDLFQSWLEHTGLELMEGFGQTETPLTVANLKGTTPKPGSMGKPVPLYFVEIQNEDGSRCNPGQRGEICIDVSKAHSVFRTAGYTTAATRDKMRHGCDLDWPAGITHGYYRDEEKTAEAIVDGWYHTGDTAWVDEDGYFWYIGRNDDVIKSSGYRIGPFEIESVLLEHDAVRECAITGVPDEIRGAVVKATVVLNEGYEGTEELTKELQVFVKEKTAPYKYPRVINYVDELPKTVNGKIRRSAIREGDN